MIISSLIGSTKRILVEESCLVPPQRRARLPSGSRSGQACSRARDPRQRSTQRVLGEADQREKDITLEYCMY